MRVEPIIADAAPPASTNDGDAAAFARALDGLADVLSGANRAEDAYAEGQGNLQDAVYERARADVALSVATATAQRTAQSLQSILNMQI